MEHAADTKAVWLHESAIEGLLEKHQAEDRQHVRDVLDKARSLSGLSLEDVAGLMAVHSQDLLDELFSYGQIREGRDLRKPDCPFCSSVHLQPLFQ